MSSVFCFFFFCVFLFFFFKQKTAYDIGTGDWSSDVCSSDLAAILAAVMFTLSLKLVSRFLPGLDSPLPALDRAES